MYDIISKNRCIQTEKANRLIRLPNRGFPCVVFFFCMMMNSPYCDKADHDAHHQKSCAPDMFPYGSHYVC